MVPTFRRIALLGLACLVTALGAAEQRLTIWWAQWAPADGLARLGQAFEKQTGIAVDVHQIPWPDFQNQVFLEFGKERTGFDIVVGDSQWLGKAATGGWYLELSDWIAEAVPTERIHPQARRYLCEYPPGSGHWFAAPCETDSVGVAYRRDWFSDPANQAAFQERFGRPLAEPQTWEELRDLATFFHRPADNRYGVVLLTGRGYDALTMGFEQLLYAFGGSWGDPETWRVRGHLDSPGAVAAADFLVSLCEVGPPNAINSDYGDTLTSFTNGSTAMMLSYYAFFPGVVDAMGDKAGFCNVPAHEGRRVVSLGGQGLSISARTSAAQQDLAKRFIAWFHQPQVQQRWVTMPACFTADTELLASESFRTATPYNAAFAASLDHLQDFWNVPEYGELLSACQRHLGRILDGEASSAAALQALAAEHEEIFRRVGRLQGE